MSAILFRPRSDLNGLTLKHVKCSSAYMRGSILDTTILCMLSTNERRRYIVTSPLIGWGGGGKLGPKIAGGVPWATENWTQKDRGEMVFWGQKDRI